MTTGSSTRAPSDVDCGRVQLVENLVAIVDDRLRIRLANPLLERYLGMKVLEGQNVLDLVADSEGVQTLNLLVQGVVSEGLMATLPDGGQLVGEAVLVRGERWIMLRYHLPVTSETSIQAKRLGGRGLEINAFETFVSNGDSRSLFFVVGPLGIGKSTLLSAFKDRCEELGCLSFRLDANTVGPSDSQILAALYPGQVTGRPTLASLFPMAARLANRRWVLLIDNFDVWVRSAPGSGALFTQLPAGCRIVLASRRRPKRAWWEDSSISITQCSLCPLSPFDSLRMASSLGIDVAARARAIRRAYGHPLSIVALAQTLSSDVDREAEALDMVVPEVAGGLSREALTLASLPVRITEDLLTELLGDHDLAATTYDALPEICIRDPDDVGLRMPEMLRHPLRERMRRRNPVHFAARQRQIALYYAKRLEDRSMAYAPTVLDDLVDTLGEHPALSRVFGSGDSDVTVRVTHSNDTDLVETAARSLGDETTAKDIVARLEFGLATTYVAEREGAIVGILQYAEVSAKTRSSEPMDRRWIAAQNALRAFGEDAQGGVLLASSIAKEDVLAWGEVSQAFARLVFKLTMVSRGTVATLIVSDLHRPARDFPTAKVVVFEGVRVSLYTTAARGQQAIVADLLNCTTESFRSVFAAWASSPPLIALEDIRFALANLSRLDVLATSPLASLDVCRGAAPAVLLQTLLRRTLMDLKESTTGRRMFEILDAVYVEKTGKHEQIATEMGFSYGTFRRQMARALESFRDVLTRRASGSTVEPSAFRPRIATRY